MRPAEIAHLIGQAELAGAGHYTPLLQAVMRAELNVCVPMRDTRMPPLWRLGKSGRPLVVLLGGDDYRPDGPDTWACAGKVREWASYAIVHGTGGQPVTHGRWARVRQHDWAKIHGHSQEAQPSNRTSA